MLYQAMQTYLNSVRESKFPEIQGVYRVNIEKVKDSCFIGIFSQEAILHDNGNNPTRCITQPLEIGLFKKIDTDILTTQIELETIAMKVINAILLDLSLGEFCIRGTILKGDEGNTIHGGNKYRYYQIIFEGKYFKES